MNVYALDMQKEFGTKGGTLTCMLADYPWDGPEQAPEWKRPAVIVVPGGGYGGVSKRESEPIALEFLSRGFQVFILHYVRGGEKGYQYPEQLIELGVAVDYVKRNAQKLFVNKDEIFVVGFSAGGHLTANLAVEYASVAKKAKKELDCKPTAIGLGYPVISKIHGHEGSYKNLLYGYNEEEQRELLKTLNLDEAVTNDTVPAFIWTTATDSGVPADNAIRYALALDKCGINYELHVYPRCDHGASTGKLEINTIFDWQTTADLCRVQRWLDDCVSFFRLFCVEKF